MIEGGFTCEFGAPGCDGDIDLVYEPPIVLDRRRPRPRPNTDGLDCPSLSCIDGNGSRFCDGTPEDCNACVGSNEYSSSSDCPSPASGTARAECVQTECSAAKAGQSVPTAGDASTTAGSDGRFAPGR